MLIIDLPKKISTNEYYRVHYMTRSKIRNQFHDAVYSALVGKHNLPEQNIEEYPVAFLYRFYFTGRLLDVTNTSAMVKMIEDGLVREGCFPDDSNKYLNSVTVEVYKSDTKENFCFVSLVGF